MIRIFTDKAPRPVGAYSQAVKSGGFIFVSGQIPIDPETGELVKGDFEKRAERCFENLKVILEAGGSSLEKVVFLSVYLVDLANFPTVNEVCKRYFAGNYPARECVGVASLPKGAEVEISAVARAD